MQIILYKTASETNRLDKQLSSARIINGTLRSESSIINPTLLIQSDDSIIGYNYLYVKVFNRYYYINDITCVRHGLYRINCHVDVLMTYSSAIKTNRAIIDRLADEEQKYLADSRYTFNSYNNYYVQKFATSLSKSLSYILVVAGRN